MNPDDLEQQLNNLGNRLTELENQLNRAEADNLTIKIMLWILLLFTIWAEFANL